MTIVLGIDPGSRITGYGLIDVTTQQHRYVGSGVIRTVATDMPTRLKEIFQGLSHIITHFKPTCFAIEQVFVHRNVSSALKLGQARGCAILAASINDLPVAEYSPRQIKQAVVGYGGAQKKQVQMMVATLLGLPEYPSTDAADALAVAWCHAVIMGTQQALVQMRTSR